MSTAEIIASIEELRSLEELIKDAEMEAESIRDAIKKTMDEQNTEELIAGTHIVRWTTTLTNRFDTTAFKKKYAELYAAFIRQTTSRRFTISQ